MPCVNYNRAKYYCQDRHRHGACADETVRRECVASCACSDDHYNATPGRYASDGCAPPRQYAVTRGTLVVINSNALSPHAAALYRSIPDTIPTMVVYGASAATRHWRNGTTSHLSVTHDSIDFTGLIATLEHLDAVRAAHPPFDRVMYLHDTVRVHDASAFAQALRRYNLRRTCSLQMGQSMNLGMYALDDLRAHRTYLTQKLRSVDRPTHAQRAALKVRNRRGLEGSVFERSGAWAGYATCGCELSAGPDAVNPVINQTHMHGRRALVYREWGLTKYQSARGDVIFAARNMEE